LARGIETVSSEQAALAAQTNFMRKSRHPRKSSQKANIEEVGINEDGCKTAGPESDGESSDSPLT
jgi:hypothetical protein